MHELPVTEAILKIVLKYAEKNNAARVVLVRLKVGRLCDVEESWIQNYFSYLSRGTVAEGAKIEIERLPAVFRCLACGESYELAHGKPLATDCPHCGAKEVEMVSGREYLVSEMEVL